MNMIERWTTRPPELSMEAKLSLALNMLDIVAHVMTEAHVFDRPMPIDEDFLKGMRETLFLCGRGTKP